jgi:hypothetical protein
MQLDGAAAVGEARAAAEHGADLLDETHAITNDRPARGLSALGVIARTEPVDDDDRLVADDPRVVTARE